MRSTYERILGEFLLQERNKDRIREFFKNATPAAKSGYLKGIYKSGTSIIHGHYVEFGPRGIEISRDESETFTWQQAADRVDELIAKGRYGKTIETENWQQMSIFDCQSQEGKNMNKNNPLDPPMYKEYLGSTGANKHR